LPLAASGLSGVAVEAEAASSALAEIASKAQHIAGLYVMWSPVLPALRTLTRGKRRFELAIVDPPRSGAKDIIEPLSTLAPQWIAYVACDPVTLARDVKALLARGYVLEGVTGYDMFPQTHHVEVLAWLARAKPPKS
jgi:23S rRNA (uracil1939-C5)-methyltransferase